MDNFYDKLEQYASNDENYKNWRKIHTQMFGEVFSAAFADSIPAQVHLTAALIKISNRQFAEAMTKLDKLDGLCANGFDEAALSYFKGLNHEMLGNEAEMTDCYEKLMSSGCSFTFPIAFHPYYRTAKLAQRDSECSKSIYYYKKAIKFFNGITSKRSVASSISQMIFEIATVYLYMHRYSECEQLLNESEKADPSKNNQRNYVKAVLLAVQGKKKECNALLEDMDPFFKDICTSATDAVLRGTDPHYCEVPQDRSGYGDFWLTLTDEAVKLEEYIHSGALNKVQTAVSRSLSDTMSFMKRDLACRVEEKDGQIVVYCKNYCVKTLKAEYAALFAEKPATFGKWGFVSVNMFEKY